MNWNLALAAFAFTIIGALLSAMTKAVAFKSNSTNSVEEFLLGGRELNRNSIVNLLLSSSFGLNALFYAMWLGFTVGIWGLIIQAAWALSFFLLAPYSTKIRSSNSLHDFLGKRFGTVTKICAAVCSVIGIMYLMGWEIGIAEATLNSFLPSTNASPQKDLFNTSVLISGTVVGTLLYTVLGGLKANASVDSLLNLFKIVVLIFLAFFLLHRFFSISTIPFSDALFPSIETVQQNLGTWGLITNILFNLSWQFVDNSSWQSIIAGGETNKNETTKNLRSSGLSIFLTAGLLGTLIGISLVGATDVNPDNIVTRAVQIIPNFKVLFTFGIFVVIVACIMSLLDGLFLALSLTLMVDFLYAKKYKLSANKNQLPIISLKVVRVLLIFIAFISIWGVKLIFYVTGLNLFEFVYIIIITQLALFGPVIIGFVANHNASSKMWLSIVTSLIVGFVSVVIGTINNVKFLLDGAGTFTLITSLLIAFLISRTSHHNIEHENKIQSVAD